MIVDWGVYWTDALPHPWYVVGDPNLRNTQEVTGYHIHATDGHMGHIADFVIDDEAWTIRYLAVDTRNWWPGKHVLVAPSRVDAIDGENRVVRLTVSRELIQQSPEYHASTPLEVPQGMAGIGQ